MEAYRLSILTPEQLARELDLIAGRRQLLAKQNKDFAERSAPAAPNRASIEEYCEQLRARLGNLTFETKRSILRLLLRKVVFDGTQIRISGAIPLQKSSGIATTETDTREPNLAMFTLVEPIVRTCEKADAARRNNLIKANKALQKRRRNGKGKRVMSA